MMYSDFLFTSFSKCSYLTIRYEMVIYGRLVKDVFIKREWIFECLKNIFKKIVSGSFKQDLFNKLVIYHLYEPRQEKTRFLPMQKQRHSNCKADQHL